MWKGGGEDLFGDGGSWTVLLWGVGQFGEGGGVGGGGGGSFPTHPTG